MDDRELERLVRMAVEAEELERSADGPLLFASITGQARGGRRWVSLLAGTGAMAAGLLVAFVVLSKVVTQPSHHGETVAKGPAKEGVIAVAPDANQPKIVEAKADEKCVVITAFRNPDGRCSCLNMATPEWNGQRLADVRRSELLDVALRHACTDEANQVFVVAVSGKADTLPKTRDEAEAIAARVAEAPVGRHSEDISPYVYAAMPQLAADATVVAERVAIRPTSPAAEKLASLAYSR